MTIHTFGRLPKTEDKRDYLLADYLPDTWREDLARFREQEAKVLWVPARYTDQDGYSHCTYFTAADFYNTPPVVADPLIDNQAAHDGYYRMVEWLGRPKDENGVEMRELMGYMLKVDQSIEAYAWAATQDEVDYWLAFKSPVICGTAWLSGMELDAEGFISVSGSLRGYHAWSYIGYDSFTNIRTGLNHWADMQRFKVGNWDAPALWQDNGEFIMTLELPRVAPQPSGCVGRVAKWIRKVWR